MDFFKKAKIRITNWIEHNEHHYEEYILFADQLDKAGEEAAAEYIRAMASLTAQSNECLRNAISLLERH